MRLVIGMPEAEYHAVKALSSTGIKEILVNPLDFWWQSWMNPARPEDNDTAARIFGRALHKFLLEGEEAFNAAYMAEPDPDDYPDALKIVPDMKDFLKKKNAIVSGTRQELVDRICGMGHEDKLWHVVFAGLIAGRTILKKDVVDQITQRCRVVRSMPSIKNSVDDGLAEVSVFWDEKTPDGIVPMKTRFDYMKPKLGVSIDAKTFNNSQRRKVVDAVAWAVTIYKYHLQAWLYYHSFKQVCKAAKAGTLVIEGPDPYPGGTKRSRNKLNGELAAIKTPRFAWLFVQNHDAPNALVREFRESETFERMGATQNGYYARAKEGVAEAVKQYAWFMKEIGPDAPWIKEDPVRAFRDEDFPMFIQDGVV